MDAHKQKEMGLLDDAVLQFLDSYVLMGVNTRGETVRMCRYQTSEQKDKLDAMMFDAVGHGCTRAILEAEEES